jgi:hypothetical protein
MCFSVSPIAVKEHRMVDIPSNRATRRALNSRRLAERYGVSMRTIPRWLERKIIPAPDFVINTRGYWFEETLDEADRKRGSKSENAASHAAA